LVNNYKLSHILSPFLVVKNGIGILHVNTALASVVGLGILGKSHVSLLTPRSVPRVPDDPVVLSQLRSVSDGSDGVIKMIAAIRVIVDTAVVEGPALGISSHGHHSLGDGIFQCLSIVSLDANVPGDVSLDELGVVLAGSVLGGVRVVRLEFDAVVPDVVEGEGGVTSVAAEVGVFDASGAVNKLLFGVALEGSRVLAVEELSTGDGSEGPA